MLIVIGLAAMPAYADSNRCVSVNGVLHGNFQTDPYLTAAFTGPVLDSNNNSTFTYTLATPNDSATGGVPGLISYCVYPAQPPGNPTSTTPNTTTGSPMDSNTQPFGDNGNAFVQHDSPVGSFSWSRAAGDPTNLDFNGATYTMGTATWDASTSCGTAPCPAISPASQTILLHINDPSVCSSIYQTTENTCWVYPNGTNPPVNPSCNGAPACKSADITDAAGNLYGDTTDLCPPGQPCVIVPENTQLFIDYSYAIVNQASNPADLTMTFKYPPSKTGDGINNGGGKDYYGCEQQPDPNGFPGTPLSGSLTDTLSKLWTLTLFAPTKGTCNQWRMIVVPSASTNVLSRGNSGNSLSFDVNMETRPNVGQTKKGKVLYEYTSSGPHLLNSGFTVKWFQNIDAGANSCAGGQQSFTKANQQCSYSTEDAGQSIYVYAVPASQCAAGVCTAP
jgi:hypothetical protein